MKPQAAQTATHPEVGSPVPFCRVVASCVKINTTRAAGVYGFSTSRRGHLVTSRSPVEVSTQTSRGIIHIITSSRQYGHRRSRSMILAEQSAQAQRCPHGTAACDFGRARLEYTRRSR